MGTAGASTVPGSKGELVPPVSSELSSGLALFGGRFVGVGAWLDGVEALEYPAPSVLQDRFGVRLAVLMGCMSDAPEPCRFIAVTAALGMGRSSPAPIEVAEMCAVPKPVCAAGFTGFTWVA
jgi:hypothetical protein